MTPYELSPKIMAAYAIETQIRELRKRQGEILKLVPIGHHKVAGQHYEVTRFTPNSHRTPGVAVPRAVKAIRCITAKRAERTPAAATE